MRFKKGNQMWKLRKRSGKPKGSPSERKGKTKENYDVLKKISEKHKLNYKLGINKCGFKKGHIPKHKGTKGVINMGDNNGMKKLTGDKHPNWKGGVSFEPYSVDWTKTLKRSIKERDKYLCQVCGDEGIYVHHIDYNKQNCRPENLITLCPSCHTKTNYNRNKWKQYFEVKLI